MPRDANEEAPLGIRSKGCWLQGENKNIYIYICISFHFISCSLREISALPGLGVKTVLFYKGKHWQVHWLLQPPENRLWPLTARYCKLPPVHFETTGCLKNPILPPPRLKPDRMPAAALCLFVSPPPKIPALCELLRKSRIWQPRQMRCP